MHLGDDVAAFVDGQLSPDAAHAAGSHLDGCVTCRQAVLQQRMLKSRMRGVGHPEPPAHLVASLGTVPHASNTVPLASPGRSHWWSRLGVGFVLLGASMAVMAVAYVVGPVEEAADEVAPPFDRFAAEHTEGGVPPSGSLTISAMAELDDHGWPCRARLAGGLERVAGSYGDDQEVKLVYSDGLDSLSLFEQAGALDPRAVEDFDQRVLANRQVWIRDGQPRVVAWDADGVVYTIVTGLDDDRLGDAIADLPRGAGEPGPVERIGDGLTQMTTWISAA